MIELMMDISQENAPISLGVERVILGGEVSQKTRVISFDGEDFTPQGGRYFLKIPWSAHNLGFALMVSQVQREKGSGYGNVVYQYVTLPNGDAVIYSDEKFKGKAVLEGI